MARQTWSWREGIGFTVQIVLLTCLLGIAVDLVTANVAVEYFTIHHPQVVDSKSPWVMALVWGVGASWWFGLIAGLLLWGINLRRTNPLPPRRIVKMVFPALGVIWGTMMAILLAILAFASTIPVSSRPATFESDSRLMAVALAHAGEYVLGAIVTIVLMVRVSRLKSE